MLNVLCGVQGACCATCNFCLPLIQLRCPRDLSFLINNKKHTFTLHGLLLTSLAPPAEATPPQICQQLQNFLQNLEMSCLSCQQCQAQ